MKHYTPDRGDLIWLDFDPSTGKEIIKRRPAFVISQKKFNLHLGLAIVAPITSTVRGIKLEVVLSEPMVTHGSVLVYQLKTFDFIERNATLIEKAPDSIIEKVDRIVRVITS